MSGAALTRASLFVMSEEREGRNGVPSSLFLSDPSSRTLESCLWDLIEQSVQVTPTTNVKANRNAGNQNETAMISQIT